MLTDTAAPADMPFPSKTARLRVGVIGLGVGRQHLAGYLLHPGCEVVAVADFDAEKLATVGREYPKIATTTSAADVLADPSISVVSIASFDADHFEQVMAGLAAGKHLFVEKPLCQTAAQFEAIRTAWAASPKPVGLVSNLVLRTAPVFGWLRGEVQGGRFGSPYAFDGDYLYGRIGKITAGWRGQTPGYSVLAGGGIHLVDLMLWITGERPARVTAVGNRMCTAGTAFRERDFVAATFEFPSGLVGRITANFGCVHGHRHVVRLFGTDATFLCDDQGPRVQRSRDPAPPAEPVALDPLPATKHALIGPFLDDIAAARDTTAATRHDFAVMAACLAADEAVRTGRPCEIPAA
jgi:predicted dehydrogenase